MTAPARRSCRVIKRLLDQSGIVRQPTVALTIVNQVLVTGSWVRERQAITRVKRL